MNPHVVEKPQWTPSVIRMADTEIIRFMARLRHIPGLERGGYHDLYRWSVENPEDFWNTVWDFCGIRARERGAVVIDQPQRFPGARWYPEARLNFAENLLAERDDGLAILFRNEQGTERSLTYFELYGCVSKLRSALLDLGVKKGDRIAGLLPNIPEAVIAMLAAASMGAVWSSCSPDFGIDGVVDRFGQIEPKILFAVGAYHYGGKRFRLDGNLQVLRERISSIEHIVVVAYGGEFEPGDGGGFHYYENLIAPYLPGRIPFEPLPFDHPLYILYSSGTTGPPKCIVHGAGGTLIQHLKEHRLHCDVHAGDRLFYFTTCGWMMWNWLVSALASKATLVLYDGSPFFPDSAVFFDLIDSAQINIFGVSAKYLDAVKKSGLEPRRSHDLSSLKTILSTGSPLAPESFDYVYDAVKADLCLSSISGGTDIVSCFVLGSPILPVWRGEIQCRGLGMKVEVFDEEGKSLERGKGELVCTAPFPSMPVGFWNDPDGRLYRSAYFEKFPGVWCHGDYVEPTPHGGMIIHGRSDATLNPGGVRIGTGEIYRQAEQFHEVLESLAVGQVFRGDERIVLFVHLRDGVTLDDALAKKIRDRIREHLSPRHVPARILQVPDIPRTKSGKIVELAVRDAIHGRPVKNLEALQNPEALAYFQNRPELET